MRRWQYLGPGPVRRHVHDLHPRAVGHRALGDLDGGLTGGQQAGQWCAAQPGGPRLHGDHSRSGYLQVLSAAAVESALGDQAAPRPGRQAGEPERLCGLQLVGQEGRHRTAAPVGAVVSAADHSRAVEQRGQRFGGRLRRGVDVRRDEREALRAEGGRVPQRLVLVTADIDAPSEAIAEALAPQLDGAAVVCCGDYSADRGSGSVPAFLAHQLEAAQALGLTGLTPRTPGCLIAQRRLDGGRREHLQVTAPAVISVEPGAARLRRASLSGLLAAREADIEVAEGAVTHGSRVQVMSTAPYRPRPKMLPPPHDPLPRARLLALTGALTERTLPRVVRASCDEAADELISYLKDKGYLT